MNRDQIVADLVAFRNRLNEAIEALDGSGRQTPRRSRTRRAMSAAARARIGAAKKAWWAKQKGKQPKKAKSRPPMSAAARAKIAAAQKARWAAHKAKDKKA
jgi:hypothetical protein